MRLKPTTHPATMGNPPGNCNNDRDAGLDNLSKRRRRKFQRSIRKHDVTPAAHVIVESKSEDNNLKEIVKHARYMQIKWWIFY